MIRRIQLQHWRAYEQLDLALTHAVTFLVAPNGVGKSSLVEAVRWALLGAPADRARGRAVRGGHDAASVTVLLSIPGSPDIEVTRTLRRNGAETFAALVDGRSITESEYLASLSAAWLADTDLLDAIIFGPPSSGKVTGFPIRDHLASLFGIDPLLRAAADFKTRRDTVATRIKSLREDLSGSAVAIGAAEQAASTLQTEVDAAEDQRQAASEIVANREIDAARAAAWEQYQISAAQYNTRTVALVSEMTDTIAVAIPSDNPIDALTASRRQAAAALEASIAEGVAAEVLAARSAGAAELLGQASGQCPTCLRPLSEHERDTALAVHGRQGGGAQNAIFEHTEETRRARQRVAAIARFSDAFAQLHPPAEPDHTDPGPDAIEMLHTARERTAELAQAHGGLLARLDAAHAHLRQLRAAAADQVQLAQLAKDDLFLELAYNTTTRLADRYLAERVAPLATQIGHRWKLLFGNDGLQFGADGHIRLGRGEIDIALADLSGGERATALLITRLILAASATKASTLWLDEPLEHLDPVRRATVAQTLVRAAQTGAVGQILITTYEEGLARRLAATAPDVVAITYARSTVHQELSSTDF